MVERLNAHGIAMSFDAVLAEDGAAVEVIPHDADHADVGEQSELEPQRAFLPGLAGVGRPLLAIDGVGGVVAATRRSSKIAAVPGRFCTAAIRTKGVARSPVR